MKLNYAKAHKRLWLWLADNPTKGKEDWPEWKYNGGKIPRMRNYCFACAMDDQGYCPLQNTPCAVESHDHCVAPYHTWLHAYPEERKKLAEKIANLKWHGPQMKEI